VATYVVLTLAVLASAALYGLRQHTQQIQQQQNVRAAQAKHLDDLATVAGVHVAGMTSVSAADGCTATGNPYRPGGTVCLRSNLSTKDAASEIAQLLGVSADKVTTRHGLGGVPSYFMEGHLGITSVIVAIDAHMIKDRSATKPAEFSGSTVDLALPIT
jgi:type II secretory pathway pseudopilin PulG